MKKVEEIIKENFTHFLNGASSVDKGIKYDENPHPKGSQEHLDWSKGHNSNRLAKINLSDDSQSIKNIGQDDNSQDNDDTNDDNLVSEGVDKDGNYYRSTIHNSTPEELTSYNSYHNDIVHLKNANYETIHKVLSDKNETVGNKLHVLDSPHVRISHVHTALRDDNEEVRNKALNHPALDI